MDDILDFTGSENNIGKPAFNDVIQGVYTLPLIFALNSEYKLETEEALDKILQDNGESLKAVFEKTEVIEKTRRIALKYVEKARTKTLELPAAAGKEVILEITDQQINRKF